MDKTREHGIGDDFLCDTLLFLKANDEGFPWFADFANYLSSIDLENRAYWALRSVNLDLSAAGKSRFLQINEVEELRNEAYERSWGYKERTMERNVKHIKGPKEFKCGDKMLLYNSWLKLFPGKLKSQWAGPFVVKEALRYGAVEIEANDRHSWKVNGHRLKQYVGGPLGDCEEEAIYLDPPGE
ncbi:uncharacterized protein LOC143621026 [Bidens hawaiensis]|uniref:uncharacterized protein LOC143621026 n=1 Tax=Bidens hawaiensis TaxID=980011 RepID=UPI00404AACC7